MFSHVLKDTLTNATAKALATRTGDDLNVVPVSMIKVFDDTIWLFDFFMDKSAKNMIDHPQVALTAWTAMKGIQLKGTVTYLTEGPDVEEAKVWVHTQNPTRVVKGLIVFKPAAIFDISPGGAFSEDDLAL